MKNRKKVNSREFQQRFGQVTERLSPGDSISVTKHGEVIGIFIKASRQKAPDFLGNLEKLGYSGREGQKLIDEICDLS